MERMASKSEKTAPEFSTSAEIPSMTSPNRTPLDSLASKLTPLRSSAEVSNNGRDRLGSPPPPTLGRLTNERPAPISVATYENHGENDRMRFSSPGPINLQVGSPNHLNSLGDPSKVSFSFPPVAMMNKVWGTGAGGVLPPRAPLQYNRPLGTERQSFQQSNSHQREEMHSPVQVLRMNVPQQMDLAFSSPDPKSRRTGVASPQPVIRNRDGCIAEVGVTRLFSPQPALRHVNATNQELLERTRDIHHHAQQLNNLQQIPHLQNPLRGSMNINAKQNIPGTPQLNNQTSTGSNNSMTRNNSDSILAEATIKFVPTSNDGSTAIGN